MSDTTQTDSPAVTSKKDFLVVGVGGSAGSIPAFREFFRHVPQDSGMAYVIVLHLSPEHESHLAEVLQWSAGIPVVQVNTATTVEPDHVYVISPHANLSMNDGTLTTSEQSSLEERRAPIDMFFRALAETHEARAVGVVMSGSGADGSAGLRRIKEHNGLVLVQDPSEAGFSDMPRNAIATGIVDFVVPVGEMPQRIISYRDQLRAMHVPGDSDRHADDQDHALMDIFTVLRLRTGHDFSNYKRSTVLRRIERRVVVCGLGDMSAYAAFIRQHHEESQALFRELLISVTNFFRDASVWEAVERSLIPKMLENKQPGDHVRIWVPGCATGEEAYSIAMLLAERDAPNVQIFATDLDEQAIRRARDGWYNEADVGDVSPERLRRFFTKDEDGYRIRHEIREMVLFAHHNLIKDPPFSHLDLISCRNLLIYLNRTAQQRAMQVLHFALEPGGYLLLGTAETADVSTNLFSVADKEAHIFQGRATERVINVMAPGLPLTAAVDIRAPWPPAERIRADSHVRERIAPIDLHQRMLEQYAPPSLIVDDQFNIVHLSESAGRFLQFPAGEASVNLLHVVRPELRNELRSALLRSAQKGTTVASRALAVHTGERTETIDLLVRPALREGNPATGFFLVLFDTPLDKDSVVIDDTPAEPPTRELEEEVVRVRTQMLATIEQYEVQAEEAKAANEELQAMNEELRSTTEELETSQEELQSVNEELQTVNQELKVKIEEISHASDDLTNLMSSTEIGTIFIDRSFRVKLFTPRVLDIFNLIPTDVGRPLLDITSKLLLEDLRTCIERVVERLETVEREVSSRDNCWYLMRLLPYRTSEDRIDGVVLTFIDITKRRNAEEALRQSEARLKAVTNLVPDLLWSNDPQGNTDWVNQRWLEYTGQSSREALGFGGLDPIHPDDRAESRRAFEAALASGDRLRFNHRLRSAGGEYRWFLVQAEPLRDSNGSIVRWFGAATDIHEERTAREFLERRVFERTSELEALSASRQQLLERVVKVQEEERQRIARELHDEMGQHITALKVGLEALRPPGGAIERMKGIVGEIDRSIDRLAMELRPAALDIGLQGAIASLVEHFTIASGIHVDVHATVGDTGRLPEAIETTLYRVVQEALNNTWKHGAAKNISVILKRADQQVQLIVEDDGVGFEVPEGIEQKVGGQFGVTGMRERVSLIGGTFSIESAPGSGTTVYARVPVVLPEVR